MSYKLDTSPQYVIIPIRNTYLTLTEYTLTFDLQMTRNYLRWGKIITKPIYQGKPNKRGNRAWKVRVPEDQAYENSGGHRFSKRDSRSRYVDMNKDVHVVTALTFHKPHINGIRNADGNVYMTVEKMAEINAFVNAIPGYELWNIMNTFEVDHINGDVSDNSPTNLAFVPRMLNNELYKHQARGMSPEEIKRIICKKKGTIHDMAEPDTLLPFMVGDDE